MIEVNQTIKLFVKKFQILDHEELNDYSQDVSKDEVEEINEESFFATLKPNEHCMKLIDSMRSELHLLTDLFTNLSSNVRWFTMFLIFLVY